DVDAGVDRVGGAVGGTRFLDEALHRAVTQELEEAIRARVLDAGEEDRGARPAVRMGAEHRREIGIGEDVAVEHPHEDAHPSAGGGGVRAPPAVPRGSVSTAYSRLTSHWRPSPMARRISSTR